jgi:hypothetical protein
MSTILLLSAGILAGMAISYWRTLGERAWSRQRINELCAELTRKNNAIRMLKGEG